MLWHAWHPKSPLSSTKLVKNVFFGKSMPIEKVQAFEKLLSPYESLLWPIGMFRPFVNVHNILQGIVDWGTSDRVMVLGGENDKLVTMSIMRRVAGTYRSAFGDLVESKKIEAESKGLRTQGEDNFGKGVTHATIPSAGHHTQNDEPWVVGAKKILSFYEQL